MTAIRALHAIWMKDPPYQREYETLETPSAFATALILARTDAGLTQEKLAERMGTKQEIIARWEGGRVMPSTRTLARLAKATGTRLQIDFVPLSHVPICPDAE